MTALTDTKRRTVLKTIGGGLAGGTLLGTASAHGGDAPRFPVWFEGEIWEMTERPPFGDLQHESTAPLWNIAPAAGDGSCPQLPGFPLGELAGAHPLFDDDAWNAVDLDHVASANPFSAIWHVHFVFDGGVDPAQTPYTPEDLVNVNHNDDPLTDGATIQAAQNIADISVPFSFNCPIRPADEEHKNYCED